MSAKTTARTRPEIGAPPNRVNLIDGIDLEAGNVIALTEMVSAVCGKLAAGDNLDEPDRVFAGLAVVADVVRGKVEGIKEKAEALYKAYVGENGGA